MSVKNMSIQEKAILVNGSTFFGTAELRLHNIPRMQFLDGGTGINFEQLFKDIYETDESVSALTDNQIQSNVINHYYEPEKLSEKEAVLALAIKKSLRERCGGNEYSPGCFPPGILLGSTWNKDIVLEIGEALGKEACIFNIHVLLGTPNINIHRDPLAGRLFEGYSEDPFLVSALAPYLIQGIQKYGVAANVKHFAANNQETNRQKINEIISQRALEEIYLPGFKACIMQGKVRTVMSAYNSINGIPCTESYMLLTEKLRHEWKSQAVVMSDWDAVSDQISSLKAGNNLKMPGPSDPYCVIKAVEDGTLSEADLDRSAETIIRLSDWINNNYKRSEILLSDMDKLVHDTTLAAYKAAAEGIILLENNGILPLQNHSTVISIVGTGSEKLLDCGTGSAGITTDRTSIFSQCLQQNLDNTLITKDINGSDTVIFISSLAGMEGNDRTDMQLPMKDIRKLYEIGGLCTELIPQDILNSLGDITQSPEKKKIILVLNVCGPVDLSYINRCTVCAVICTFLPGMQGAAALADIISGKINPSGKLPITFPVKHEDTPSYLNFPGDGYEVCYGEGIFNGYRYYEKKKIKPLYYFGYGLSYTQFSAGKILNLEVDETISFDICITNTGNTDGAQVIQIYISDPYSTLTKPVKELKAFEKVFLAKGESRTIHFDIPLSQLASYDSDLEKWTVEEGYYDVIAAFSSSEDDIADKKRFYLDIQSPYNFGLNSSLKTIYENSQLRELLIYLWTTKGWDIGVIYEGYQYTPGKTLAEIISQSDPKWNKDDDQIKEMLAGFLKVQKL